ncbi:hypothetical protein DAEQUDRAFT_763387 [Daedalea quercina L-15889]|uniref:C2H2-type domain-containing protein n=1 Tax=Daedalea quercina L-15889 TaxID=1314783 RepID=A0A165SFA1_9APHY|nr:hypothetical protein DAEQUDRAFT_763387 [Daedalea quercina L-15889]
MMYAHVNEQPGALHENWHTPASIDLGDLHFSEFALWDPSTGTYVPVLVPSELSQLSVADSGGPQPQSAWFNTTPLAHDTNVIDNGTSACSSTNVPVTAASMACATSTTDVAHAEEQTVIRWNDHTLPILTPTDGVGYQCGYADCMNRTSFTMLKDLWRHQSSIHLQAKAKCPCCENALSRMDGLKRHLGSYPVCGKYVLHEVNLLLDIERDVGGVHGPETERVSEVKALRPKVHLAPLYTFYYPRET